MAQRLLPTTSHTCLHAGGNDAEVQRLLEEAAAAAQARSQLEMQLDAARAATAAVRLDHETTKVGQFRPMCLL